MSNSSLANIKLLLLDVDGVLTDGSIIYTGAGMQTMAFNVKDGLGLKMIRDAGVITCIVTGRESDALTWRVQELGIDFCYDGVSDKGAVLEQILEKTGCTAPETAFVGDDLPDIPLMARVGFPMAVADASPEVISRAALVTTRPGGKGAVREICDMMLKSRGLWADMLKQWE